MRASIVINTYNRRQSLSEALASLCQLRYPDFEVVVVNGPSTDGTDELLQDWKDTIKIGHCPVANLAVSRNIGIAAAAGDIVAFIDDDAIPDPQWLDNVIGGYDSDEIGAVGGLVYNSTGYDFQAKYIVSDRFGESIEDVGYNPTELYNIPGAPRYAAHMGTNTSFRRSLLLELGGFDEEFAYYLDETDLCLRVVDSGHVVKFVDDAFVYHKFASSDLRVTYEGKGVLVKRYQLLKNKAYFAFKHGAPAHGCAEAMQRVLDYVEWHREDVKWGIEWCAKLGRAPPETTEDLEQAIRRGVADGIERAVSGQRVYLSRERLVAHASPFKRFERRLIAPDRMNLCLFTQQYPPKPIDGIGRCVHELSMALVSLGHTVHVLTISDTHNRVDLEDGVWVHRLTVKDQPKPFPCIPQHIWNYSRTMMDEVERIDRFDRVDLIEAPAWDCEGIAALLGGEIPVVTSLHTPMLIVASMHPNWMTDGHKMESEIYPILSWERRLMLFSDGLAANTNAIIETIEREYDLALDRERVAVVGHGLRDRLERRSSCQAAMKAIRSPCRAEAERSASEQDPDLRLLYVGRLEYRKGIDVLLTALQRLLPEFPRLRVDIVGEEVAEAEKSFEDQFLESAGGAAWASRVRFHGRVDEALLDEYLEACDIFVAPSRFESFGLIFLEAMIHGKPCVATGIGGVVEVVVDGETGLLVKPGDPELLEKALRRLILSDELRRQLGRAGRRRYVARFTARAWAERSIEHFKRIRSRARVVRRHRTFSSGPVGLSRHCNLSEFWMTGTLYSLLSKIGSCSIDWRLWAYCLLVETLTQKAEAAGRKALVIADHQFPDIKSHASGWEFQSALLSERQSGPLDGRASRRLTRLGYRAAEFELVYCLAILDPLDDKFAPCVSEIARVCRPGGTVHLLIALGEKVRHGVDRICENLDQARLRAKVNLESFLHGAAPSSSFCEEGVEPYLGVRIAGEGRPLAVVEFERLTARPGVRPGVNAPGPSAEVTLEC